jgi:hypothetical protein
MLLSIISAECGQELDPANAIQLYSYVLLFCVFLSMETIRAFKVSSDGLTGFTEDWHEDLFDFQ